MKISAGLASLPARLAGKAGGHDTGLGLWYTSFLDDY